MEMFNRLNAQQQPFIQSGYGALGKLNTLLGIGSRPRAGGAPMPLGGNASLMPREAPNMGNHMYRPTPNGGMQQIVGPAQPGAGGGGGGQSMRLRQLLALRAMNGDTEAERMLGMVG